MGSGEGGDERQAGITTMWTEVVVDNDKGHHRRRPRALPTGKEGCAGRNQGCC